MTSRSLSILGISGSLRPDASSSVLLRWILTQFPSTITTKTFPDIAQIPAFDGSEVLPAAVSHLINEIKAADLIIFCSPEYAHGVPGALKNALDWTVSSDAWMSKKAVIVTASSQGDHAHAALMEILRTMSAEILAGECVLVPFIKAKIDPAGTPKDPVLEQRLYEIVSSLVQTLLSSSSLGSD